MSSKENHSVIPSGNSDVEASATDFSACLARIREVLAQSRNQALMAVNTAMVQAYWNVGREIVEEEQRGEVRAGYGARLLSQLSRQLCSEFGNGFKARN